VIDKNSTYLQVPRGDQPMSHLAIVNTPSGYPEWWDAAKRQKWKREPQDIQWHQSVAEGRSERPFPAPTTSFVPTPARGSLPKPVTRCLQHRSKCSDPSQRPGTDMAAGLPHHARRTLSPDLDGNSVTRTPTIILKDWTSPSSQHTPSRKKPISEAHIFRYDEALQI
jgi:hypothetical protein